MGSKMTDLSGVIGIYALCNTAAVLVHQIDYGEDRVLASLNGMGTEWCGMTEEYSEETHGMESGFYLGSIFVPFWQVMRFYGGRE